MPKEMNMNCNLLTNRLVCELPEQTVDVLLKVRTKTGEHTFREDVYTCTLKYRRWNNELRPFRSLKRRVANIFQKWNSLSDDSTLHYWALDIAQWLEYTWRYYLMHFTCFCCLGHFPCCIIPFLEGEPPLPRSTPWGAYRSASHVSQYLFLSFDPSAQQFLLLHSLLVDRSTVVGHVPIDHTCSFMCTSHIDMAAHNLAFIWVG